MGPGKLGRGPFNGEFALTPREFETARETRADRIEFVIALQFELWINLWREPSLAQSLKRILAFRIIRIRFILVPAIGTVLVVIPEGFTRCREIRGGRHLRGNT